MRIVNKRVGFDFEVIETIEAGIALMGSDMKLMREGKVDLRSAYIKIVNGEALLFSTGLDTRKLLLHKDEIYAFEAKIKAKGLTLVPAKLYTKGHLVKVEVALAKAKRKFEKKESIQKKDILRDTQREMRPKE